MKKYIKTLYIIPGWKETTKRAPYQKIAENAIKKGYTVVFKNVNWKKTLSSQFFPVEKEAVIFGFSLGAVLARLVAGKYPCKHILLASMTPLNCFSTDKKMKKALIEVLGTDFVRDAQKNLGTSHYAKKQTIFYGDKEGEDADVLVANTDHEITDEYIKQIDKILN